MSISSSNIGDSLQISSIRLRLVEDGTDGLIAWASCIVADAIKLDNISIRRGRDGSLFLTYPSKRTAGGEKYAYFNPVSTAAADAVQDAILSRLAVLAKAGSEGSARTT